MNKNVNQGLPVSFQKYGYALALTALLVMSLLIRIKFMFQERLWADEALYAWNAMRIAGNPLLLFSAEVNEFHPPLFSGVLAAGSLFHPALPACRIVSLIIGLLCILMMYVLGRRIMDPFGGLICAVLLSFNATFLKFSTKILSDSLFMLLMMLAALILLEVSGKKGKRLDFYLGGAGAALVLTKWSGAVVVILITVFYLLGLKNLSGKERIRKLVRPVSVILGTAFLLLLNNRIQLGTCLPDMSALLETTKEPASRWFYVLGMNDLLGSAMLTVLALIGMAALLKGDNKPVAVLLFSWGIVFMVALSCAAERLFRYSLVYLPALIVFAALGVNALMEFFFSKEKKSMVRWLMLGLVCFIAGIQYPETHHTLSEERKFYLGFPDAGSWVRQNARPETVIIANSPRFIRYYSGVNFARFGGQLIEFPKNRDEVKGLLETASGHVILVLDNWGKEEDVLIRPGGSPFQDFLERKGYRQVKSIGKLRYRLKGRAPTVAPVIFIFEKKGP